MFAFGEMRPRRRPSLTPMIDVVFLLLVFFMLAARFGQSGALPVLASGGSGAYDGPPRLVSVAPETIRLNGVVVGLEDLPDAIGPLVGDPGDLIVLQPDEDADLQRLVDVMQVLQSAGFERLSIVEAR